MFHDMRQPYFQTLEKDDFSLKHGVNKICIANASFTKSASTFICCPEFYFFLKNNY